MFLWVRMRREGCSVCVFLVYSVINEVGCIWAGGWSGSLVWHARPLFLICQLSVPIFFSGCVAFSVLYSYLYYLCHYLVRGWQDGRTAWYWYGLLPLSHHHLSFYICFFSTFSVSHFIILLDCTTLRWPPWSSGSSHSLCYTGDWMYICCACLV